MPVRFRLVPRDEGFFPLFNEAAENVAECARRLRDLLDHFAVDAPLEADGRDLEKLVTLIGDCERRGDELTRTILSRLNSSFVTPFDREDIHALTEELDDVVDEMQAAADLLVLHRVEKPLPEVRDLADVLVKAAEASVALIAKLPRPARRAAASSKRSTNSSPMPIASTGGRSPISSRASSRRSRS